MLTSIHLSSITDILGSFVHQISADRMTKIDQLFYVKWIDINNQGYTWKPASHLVGEKADALLESYLKMRANEKDAT
jgi:hypothetical protein